jgi:hypothetical protein
MTRLSPRRDASFKTSSVAIIVTAIPFTRAVESPALKVSTVRSESVTPLFCLMRPII